MSESKLLVYRCPASPAQIRITSGVALGLLLAYVATLFFRNHILPPSEFFVAITSPLLIMADWITATLLFAQARVLRARSLQVLAAGYFLAGLLVALRILSLPDVLGHAKFGPDYNLPLWFYLASHTALAPAVMAYVWLNPGADQTASPGHRPPGRTLAASILLAGSVILVVTTLETSLPWSSPIFLTATAVMLLIIAGMVVLGRSLHAVLDLWLLLMLWGWFLETALIALPSSGYTAGWYAARSLGLTSGLFVLFTLLAETSKFYGRTVLQLMAQQQEREHRFLIHKAITGSIAHDIRQPLSAILLNAQMGKRTLSQQERGVAALLEELDLTLNEIVTCSDRANSILKSTRTIFGRENMHRSATDPAVLLRTTLAMVADSARAQEISTELVIEGPPKPININRMQMQQALLNLFQNAVDALSHAYGRNRTMRVSCVPWGDVGVIIRVEDNGPGILPADREKIFETFFTTRVDGTGLGLPIARAVIEDHGGRISAEPRSPVGTAFVIRLPYGGEMVSGLGARVA